MNHATRIMHARVSELLAKEACCPILHSVRNLKAPIYKLERDFSRPGIT